MGYNDPSASSTSKDLASSFNLIFERLLRRLRLSAVIGEQYTDAVTIAGLTVHLAMFFFSFPTSAHMSHHRRRTRGS